MEMMHTPIARAVVMVVITISTGDDVATDSERGDDGGAHYQQWR